MANEEKMTSAALDSDLVDSGTDIETYDQGFNAGVKLAAQVAGALLGLAGKEVEGKGSAVEAILLSLQRQPVRFHETDATHVLRGDE
jgi:hypothetical protein